MECHARHRSNGACCRVWLARSDSPPFAPPKNCSQGTPNCFGSIREGMPLRSTNRIPVRQTRSDTRGRPRCGFGTEAGRSGPIKLHSASGTSAAAITIPPSRESQTLELYNQRFCYRHLVFLVTFLYAIGFLGNFEVQSPSIPGRSRHSRRR